MNYLALDHIVLGHSYRDVETLIRAVGHESPGTGTYGTGPPIMGLGLCNMCYRAVDTFKLALDEELLGLEP